MQIQSFKFDVRNVGGSGEISGLGAAFGNIDHAGTIIARGAFAKSLEAHAKNGTRPAMLLHHKLDRPIGTWRELRETDEGLEVTGKLSIDTRDGREAYALARDGALTGLSVGFLIRDQAKGADATEIRDLDLFEISMVSIPANDKARLRRVNSLETIRDVEDLLREGGWSRRIAKRAAAAAWSASNEPCDDDEAADILRRSIEDMQAFRGE